ncbi:MAG TPA: dienelactone hydrolase family protein [Gemmatimonadaceae bacterium]|nr:dienelactone hydrolase family protein [Gemmatimonadaceae bacterium]
MGHMVEFKANGRNGTGYLATPPGGKGKGLIVVQEYWGLVDHIKDLAERFAKAGYVALSPDLYNGKTAKSPDEAGKMLMALNIAEAGKDMKGSAEFLLASGAVTSKRVGIVGFCMGGQLAMYAGMEYPELIAAVVDFYGIHPAVKIDAKRFRIPALGHFGKQDKSVSEESVQTLATSINGAGGSFEYHYYDAGHAFFNDTRPVYSEPDAKVSWQRTLDFLGAHVS